MSESDGGPGQREVAYRLFAAEFEDADLDYSESDEERAPNYVITPTGARVNRLFVVGVLTEVEPVSDDVLRARVVDPTGAFVLYAGQYQQDERAFLERADPPAFVAVTGKARTFQPDDSDRVFTSVRPESVSEVDADTRDRWTVDAAEQTFDRLEAMATAMALGGTGDTLRDELESRGVEEGLADGIALALDHYGTTPTYLAAVRELALDAARLVTGDVEEVAGLDASPGDAGDVTATDLLPEPVESTRAGGEPPEQTPEPAAGTGDTDVAGATDRADADAAATADTTDTTDAEASDSAATETEPGPETPEAAPSATTGAGENEAAAGQPAGSAEPAEDEADVDAEGPGDFEPGEFDLDESERDEIEAEYGTEFRSGTEVDDPGEADIETPEPAAETSEDGVATEETAPESAASESGVGAEEDSPDSGGDQGDAVSDDTEAATAESDASEDVDLVDAVVAAMEDLDEGDGAGRDAVVDAVTDRTGADADAVGEAIQDALMDGRCYEPADDTYKPI